MLNKVKSTSGGAKVQKKSAKGGSALGRKTEVKKDEEKTAKVLKKEKVEKESPKKNFYLAIGRRKTAIAKVKIQKGTGKITINDKETASPSRVYTEPLKKVGLDGKYDCWVKVYGGGLSSQLEAIRLGVSRALIKVDPDLKKTLKLEGFLTRDPRMKERKKPGLKGARKAPQWAKR